MHQRPKVGVSQCLLGDAVRYDGQSKANQTVLNKFHQVFDLVPVCPEVEAGLGIPRPPVQLSANVDTPKLTGRDDASIDVTDIMQKYCQHKPAELQHLHGFIFKSRSPSCGLDSTPVFINDLCVTENSRGVFARAITSAYPQLPAIEENAFDELAINTFIDAVFIHFQP